MTWRAAGPLGVIELLGQQLAGGGSAADKDVQPPLRPLLCSFSSALKQAESDASLFDGVDPSIVVPGFAARFFGRPDHTIFSTAVLRCHRAIGLLHTLLRLRAPCRTDHARGVEGCVRCPVHRLALLLRLFVITHMDLLSECVFNGSSDRRLCERPTRTWPSPYEENYPYGTRCRWSGTLPPLCEVLDFVHWFVKEQQQHKSHLLLCLQKACPHKYMGRASPDKLDKACLSDGPMCQIVAELVLCSELGGYSHSLNMPYLPRTLALWWGLKVDRFNTLRGLLKACPSYVLFAWKEAVVWSLPLRDDLMQFVVQRYEWDRFSEVTVECMNRMREFLARPGRLDAADLEKLAKSCHEGTKNPSSKRVLRLPFRVLACKHLDGLLRAKLRQRRGVSGTGIPAMDRCGEDQLANPLKDDLKENLIGRLALIQRSAPDMSEVLRVAQMPERTKCCLRYIEKRFSAFSIADTDAKRKISAAIAGLDDSEFLSLHRAMCHASAPNEIRVLPLSRAASESQLRIIRPEDRPVYICSCCGRVGTTVTQRNAKGEPELKRGLKNVAYSFACNAVFCNKKTKKTGSTKKRGAQARTYKKGHTLVPKQLMDRLLLKSCAKRPMTCVDKRGVMIRVNCKAFAACCSCGALADVSGASTLSTEPTCAVCEDRVEREAEAAAAERRSASITCQVCSAWRPAEAMQPSLVFQDVDRSDADTYNRVVLIKACRRHVEDPCLPVSLRQMRKVAKRGSRTAYGIGRTKKPREHEAESADEWIENVTKQRRKKQYGIVKRMTRMKKRAREYRVRFCERMLGRVAREDPEHDAEEDAVAPPKKRKKTKR